MIAHQKTQHGAEELDADYTPNRWSEATDPFGWIMWKLEEAEEEGYPVGGPEVPNNLEPEISRTLDHQPCNMTRWY